MILMTPLNSTIAGPAAAKIAFTVESLFITLSIMLLSPPDPPCDDDPPPPIKILAFGLTSFSNALQGCDKFATFDDQTGHTLYALMLALHTAGTFCRKHLNPNV